MAQKKRKRYRMDWNGKSVQTAMAMVGLALFLRAVYYFGCVRIEKVAFWELLTWLILPMLVEIVMIVLLRVLKWDAPGIYAIMASMMGLLLILQTIGQGSVLRIILAIVGYIACSVLMIGVAGGHLSKQIAVAGYLTTALVRFFAFELSPYIFRLRLVGFIREAAGLLMVLALVCLTNALKERKRKK